jgi:hypothetical protein
MHLNYCNEALLRAARTVYCDDTTKGVGVLVAANLLVRNYM